jgi:S1-C subfamily serine protease
MAGRDPSTDVAVLRAKDIDEVAPIALNPADDVGPGNLAVAVGRRPEGTIAHFGAVSVAGGPWRSMRGGQIDRFMRLDLRLDTRAEGGVLLDARNGRAFGMAVYGPRRSVLAIPAPTIERVADHLLTHGRIGRGYLGLGLRPVRLDDDTARRLAIAEARGLIVVNVDPDGPAHRAGVLQGDVVMSWNGEPVRRVREVLDRLGPDCVGRAVSLSLVRAGQAASAQVAIIERSSAAS